jgi:hypothetical protein
MSLSQWLALTPPQLVQAHLNLSSAALATLQGFQVKQYVV